MSCMVSPTMRYLAQIDAVSFATGQALRFDLTRYVLPELVQVDVAGFGVADGEDAALAPEGVGGIGT